MDDSDRTSSHDLDRWQARVARAAAAAVGRAGDPKTERAAETLLDRGRTGAAIALAILALVGGIVGWAGAREVFRPTTTSVNVAIAILVLVGGPWLLIALRTIVLMTLGRRVGSWLGRLMPYGFVRFTERQSKDRRLGVATARHLGSLLTAGAGRHLASLGGATFWCGYAVAAVLAIWLSTARVAYGFGWESSWMSPEVGRDVVRAIATPLGGVIDVDALAPVDADPEATETLEARRRWITLLSAAIAAYLLLPMVAWAGWHAVRGHLAAGRWRPPNPTPTTERPGPRSFPAKTDPTATTSTSGCTHLVRLEHGDDQIELPAPIASLTDLGAIDGRDDLARLAAATPTRVAILAWLPATPDRGVVRRIDGVVAASKSPPVVILDGGEALRSREPDRTVVARLADWREAARASGSEVVECDLGAATGASRRLLDAVITGRTSAELALDPAILDASFGAIGRGLDASPPIPDPDSIAAVAGAIAELHDRDHDAVSDWIVDLRSRVTATLGGADLTPETLRDLGTTLLPSSLRRSVVWIGVGGILGIGACAAIATVAPAALAALPGWAGSGAGLGGVLGVARTLRRGKTTDTTNDEPSPPSGSALGEAVLGLAGWSVLWWSQGGDEVRTTRLLEALHPDDEPPHLADADAARRWLAAARQRLLEVIA